VKIAKAALAQETAVSRDENADIAKKLLACIGRGAEPDEIAALFRHDAELEIAGDVGALPWIGRQVGRNAVSDFFRDVRRLTQPVRFDVQAVMADESRAVILGTLASKVSATGRVIETAFAIILMISDRKITRFQMLEDSFAVSRAARP
jgi:hypothetical protein